MKLFDIIVANENGAHIFEFSGAKAASSAFAMAILAATPMEPRKELRYAQSFCRTASIGEEYVARHHWSNKDACYMITIRRLR